MEEWRRLIRETRERLGLSQKRLAELSGLSHETVRKYESGARNPTRQHLGGILLALHIDRRLRNRVLIAAGFAGDGLEQLAPNAEEWWFTEDEAAAEIETYPWPSFVLSERAEVLCANQVVQRLWGVDLSTEFLDPVERNILSVASLPRFADRCLNWDEVIGRIAQVFKSYHRQREHLEDPTPYFGAVLKHFLAGDQKYVDRFAKLWEEAPLENMGRIRFDYPIVWDLHGVGILRFKAIASTLNEPDGLACNDWIPLDGATWDALATLAERDAEAPGAAAGR